MLGVVWSCVVRLHTRFPGLGLGMDHQDDVETEDLLVNYFPAQGAMLPAGMMRCLPLSQRLRELFLVTWVPVVYGIIAVNVIVLKLLGIDILVAEAVAISVGFAAAEVIRRTVLAGAYHRPWITGGLPSTAAPFGRRVAG
ncbi:hypothetical protein AB0N89_18350 [Amycolatopsis sp. NPDC089917]|uniref:hypothetical protein n=1 Tax=Amycolatopsis sp. NPDC089917 TaxID=3155187 RepID=UPI00341F20E5